MKEQLTRAAALLRQEAGLQKSQGILYLYLLFALLYILLIRVLPPSWRQGVAAGLLLSDPTVLGFFFSGTILFRERELFPSLFVTPLKPGLFLAARALSFLVLSLLLSLLFLTGGLGLNYRPGPVLLGLVLTAPFFTFSGMYLSFRFRDVLSYLIAGGFLMTLFFLPLLELLPQWRIPLYLPTRSSLFFFRLALFPEPAQGLFPGDYLLAALIAAGETGAAYLLCRGELVRFTAGRGRI